MNEELEERAQAYAAANEMTLGKTLGSGIHGIVYRAKGNAGGGRLALKFYTNQDAYRRERDAYLRLGTHEVTEIVGFNVPQMLSCDEEWLVIAITIVRRPFALDFAAAYLDRPPHFSEEVLGHAEEEAREKFGDRWPTVLRVLDGLRGFGVHQTDVSPGNIGFVD